LVIRNRGDKAFNRATLWRMTITRNKVRANLFLAVRFRIDCLKHVVVTLTAHVYTIANIAEGAVPATKQGTESK
jgi:hypothetical protein